MIFILTFLPLISPCTSQSRGHSSSSVPASDQCVNPRRLQRIRDNSDQDVRNLQNHALALIQFEEACRNFTVDLFKSAYKSLQAQSITASSVNGVNNNNNKGPSNLIFSPYSIWQAIMLTYLVSNNRLSQGMAKSLGFENIAKVRVN